MAASLATRIAAEHAAAAGSLSADVARRERRRAAIETLSAEGLPTSRDENWKYANLRPLEKVKFAAPVGAQAGAGIAAADLPAAIEGYSRYVFVDGVFAPELSSALTKVGITVRSLRAGGAAAVSMPLVASRDARFALLNDAFAVDGAEIRVSAGTDCPTCIE